MLEQTGRGNLLINKDPNIQFAFARLPTCCFLIHKVHVPCCAFLNIGSSVLSLVLCNLCNRQGRWSQTAWVRIPYSVDIGLQAQFSVPLFLRLQNGDNDGT